MTRFLPWPGGCGGSCARTWSLCESDLKSQGQTSESFQATCVDTCRNVASESARYVLMHGRMTSAQQATEVGTVPVNRQVKARAEHLRYRLEFDEAQGPRSALDLTDQTP